MWVSEGGPFPSLVLQIFLFLYTRNRMKLFLGSESIRVLIWRLGQLCRFCRSWREGLAPGSSCGGAANPVGYALCRRPLTIAHCSQFADFLHCCKLILAFLVLETVIWHTRCLHFGVLGDSGTMLGHWGAQERTRWGPGFDFS